MAFGRRLTPTLGALALIIAACSGRSVLRPPEDDAGATGATGGTSGSGGKGGRGGTGGSAGLAGKAGMAGTGGTGEMPFEDPGCPDIPPPDAIIECDVFDSPGVCGEGFACKPELDHPFGSGCDQEVLNMRCVLPGTGQQGEPCDDGMTSCADGFICVIGASHGARCLHMCPLDGSIRCPSGYVCGPTDADGIGVCA